MLLVELVEYECILVAGIKPSLHHMGCFLTKMPPGPLDENPIIMFYNQVSNNCLG